MVVKNDQFSRKNLCDSNDDFSTINRYHVVSCNRIAPGDYGPNGLAAAAADGPNLVSCGLSRKLKTISIKICLSLLQDESDLPKLFYNN